jgi:hypothetical protein
MSFLQPETLLG